MSDSPNAGPEVRAGGRSSGRYEKKILCLVRAFSLCLLLYPATIRLPARGSLLTGTGAPSARVHRIPAPCSLSPCGMCVGPPLELGSVGSLSSLLLHNASSGPQWHEGRAPHCCGVGCPAWERRSRSPNDSRTCRSRTHARRTARRSRRTARSNRCG